MGNAFRLHGNLDRVVEGPLQEFAQFRRQQAIAFRGLVGIADDRAWFGSQVFVQSLDQWVSVHVACCVGCS